MIASLLHELARQGVSIMLSDGGKLRLRSNRGKPPAEVVNRLRTHKADIVTYLECFRVDERIVARINNLFANGKATFEELEALDERRGDAIQNRDLEALSNIERVLSRLAQTITETESEWSNRPELNASWVADFSKPS